MTTNTKISMCLYTQKQCSVIIEVSMLNSSNMAMPITHLKQDSQVNPTRLVWLSLCKRVCAYQNKKRCKKWAELSMTWTFDQSHSKLCVTEGKPCTQKACITRVPQLLAPSVQFLAEMHTAYKQVVVLLNAVTFLECHWTQGIQQDSRVSSLPHYKASSSPDMLLT